MNNLQNALRQSVPIERDGKRLFMDTAHTPIGAEMVFQEGFVMKKIDFGVWREREATQDELDTLEKLSENYSSPE